MSQLQVLTIVVEVLSLIGVVVSATLVWIRIEGLAALRRLGRNGDARHVSRSDIRGESIMLAVFLQFLAIGVTVHIATFRGEPPFNVIERWAISNAGEVLRYCLIGIIVLLLIKQVWKVLDWQRLTGLTVHDVVLDAVRHRVDCVWRSARRRMGGANE